MHTRRATPDDGPAISALITNCGGTPKYRKRFGSYNVANLLESSFLALVVSDQDVGAEGHQMLGFLVFSDGPRAQAHTAEAWLAAFSAFHFPSSELTIGNSVWLEFCVAEGGSAGRRSAALAAGPSASQCTEAPPCWRDDDAATDGGHADRRADQLGKLSQRWHMFFPGDNQP